MKIFFKKLGQKLSVLLFYGFLMTGSLAFSATVVDAHWPLDNSTDDVTGNNYNLIGGTITFSTTSILGTHSGSFNGTTEYLQYSGGSNDPFLNQAITIFSYSFWVNPANLDGNQTLLDEGGGTNGIAIRLNGNILECAVREGGTQKNTPTFTFPDDNAWHHIAITYNNGDVIMYLDASASITLNTGFGQLSTHPSDQAFGRSSGDAFGATGNYYEGLMDDIKHYTSVLAQSDINALIVDTDSDGIFNDPDVDDDNDGVLDTLESLPVSGYDAYWPFNHSTEGNSTNDDSGDGHNLVAGSVEYSTVSPNNTISASFNGTSNYLQYNDGTFLNQAITYFSYSFWVKPNTLTGIQTLLDEGGFTNGIAIRLEDNILKGAVRENFVQFTTSDLIFPDDNEWHHIAVTYNSGDVILYLDGVARHTLNTGFDELAPHSDTHAFGRRNNDSAFGQGTGNYYNGLMDEILHYPSVLSPGDITALYLSGTSEEDPDNDGIPNHQDLDSDNDGIADNVEAQPTSGSPFYIAPRYPIVDDNDNGLDDQYESAEGGTDIVPVDTDTDGIPDYLDNNSDDDNITDCEEGLPANTTDKNCTVNTVEGNGLVDWAGGVADYSDVNGIVDTPLSDLQNILDTTAPEDEVDYRQFNTCGPSTLGLTTFQWKIISFGCDTGTNNIDMLLGNSLGAYGTNWVMYEQDTENGTTGQLRMEDTDKVRPGKGYWIIADQDVNMTVDLGATDDIIKKTEVEAKGNYGITTGTAFDEVMQYTLLNSQTDKKTKVMLGNPFHKKFELSDMYYNSGNNVPSTYYPMDDTDNIGAYVEYTVYAHDSANTSSSNDEYIAITPGTPGMSSPIEPMIGFFLLMRVDPDMGSNSVVFPLEK